MPEKKVVLVTGFEPFGGDTFNPSLETAKSIDGTTYKDYVICGVGMPNNRSQCIGALERAIEEFKPEIVIPTGLAWGRSAISVERVGINVVDYPVPDNEGYMALNEPIDPEGPDAYFATVPIRAMVKAIRDAGIPAYVSNTAGTHNCNIMLYSALHYIARNKLPMRAGMIHLPFTPQQVAEKQADNLPSLPLDLMVKAVEEAAKAAIDNQVDIELVCGAVN